MSLDDDVLGAYAAAATNPSDIDRYKAAISGIESGGSYDKLGPVTRSGDRAYGRYQIMGNNIGPWTEAHLGRRMTPQEFLADPQAQDKVFAGQFGNYVSRYGNTRDAASMWFTGRPYGQVAGNPNVRDVLGTTADRYVRMFEHNLANPTTGNPSPPANSPMAAGAPPVAGSSPPVGPPGALGLPQGLPQGNEPNANNMTAALAAVPGMLAPKAPQPIPFQDLRGPLPPGLLAARMRAAASRTS